MLNKSNIKSFVGGLLVGLVLFTSGAVVDRLVGIGILDGLVPGLIENRSFDSAPSNSAGRQDDPSSHSGQAGGSVVDIVEEVSQSVVTVSVKTPERRVMQFNPFGGFSSRVEGGEDQDIGTGFIVDSDGLIITNKHVVNSESATYKVITSNNSEYEVIDIKRDPANDLAIIKIDPAPSGAGHALRPLELGDSGNLKVGQGVIAIGTALGEFRHTVTTGVISGLGRGITAGSVYQGYVERLDDVIQTDAAINPGNSGGPLVDFNGRVIGVNVAVASGAQNIAFAIPIDVVRDGLQSFESSGSFASKPFLGVEYQMVSERSAILNEVPQGAYVTGVVDGSAASAAGVQEGDIITKFDGREVRDNEEGLSELIGSKKPGDRVDLEVWREGDTIQLQVTLNGGSD
jgi:serine protease Do/serine protease DegQ